MWQKFHSFLKLKNNTYLTPATSTVFYSIFDNINVFYSALNFTKTFYLTPATTNIFTQE